MKDRQVITLVSWLLAMAQAQRSVAPLSDGVHVSGRPSAQLMWITFLLGGVYLTVGLKAVLKWPFRGNVGRKHERTRVEFFGASESELTDFRLKQAKPGPCNVPQDKGFLN